MAAEDPKKGEKFMKKAERKQCWDARDEYWSCLDKYLASGDDSAVKEQCKQFRDKYTEFCPPTWVTHFDRKYRYEKFKVLLKTEGFQERADDEFMNRKK